MSADDRRRLGEMARALIRNDVPTPRAAALGRVLTGQPRAAVSLAALASAPAWLAVAEDARRRLGHRAALATIATELAGSVDGAWLGGLAEVVGDDVLDWAMALPAGPALLPRFDRSTVSGVADSLLRTAAPAALRDYGASQASEPAIDPAIAHAALATALQAAPT